MTPRYEVLYRNVYLGTRKNIPGEASSFIPNHCAWLRKQFPGCHVQTAERAVRAFRVSIPVVVVVARREMSA